MSRKENITYAVAVCPGSVTSDWLLTISNAQDGELSLRHLAFLHQRTIVHKKLLPYSDVEGTGWWYLCDDIDGSRAAHWKKSSGSFACGMALNAAEPRKRLTVVSVDVSASDRRCRFCLSALRKREK